MKCSENQKIEITSIPIPFGASSGAKISNFTFMTVQVIFLKFLIVKEQFCFELKIYIYLCEKVKEFK